MQFLILALPFLATVFIVIFEFIFSPEKFWFSRTLGVVWPVLTLAIEIILIWQPAANSSDGAFVFSELGRVFLSLLFLLTSVALLVAYATGNLLSGKFSPATLGVCGAVIAALYLANTFLQVLFLALAGLISIVALVDVENEKEERFVPAIKASVRYLIATVLFGLTIYISLIFLERLKADPQLTGLIKVIVALAVVGFAMRLAVFPFSLWLPEVLEEAPGLSGFLVVGVINAPTIVLLVDFLQRNPAILFENYTEAQPVMLLTMSGAMVAAVLALGQNGFGKMLAYTASADFGLILFGLVSPHRSGLNGAIFEALNLAFMHLLIFGATAIIAYCNHQRVWTNLTGLGRRMPGAAIALMIGVLGMVGLPFTAGFVGKYLILQSAAQEGLPWALAGGVTIVCSAVAYLRYFHRVFMGNDVPGLRTLPEPRVAVLLLLVVAGVIIFVGLWPAPVLSWLDSALRATS